MKTRLLFGMIALCCFTLTAYGKSDPTSFVKKRYPDARVLDRDWDDGFIEVKMAHRGKEKIAIFNHGEKWLRTMWEIRREQLPRAVINTLRHNGFVYEEIDDNDNKALENGRGLFYIVQADRNDRSYVLVISERGNILDRFYDDEWDDEWDKGRFEDVEWDDGEDHFDEGDDEWNNHKARSGSRPHHRDWDDGEDHFEEGDDEWEDGEP